MTIEEAIEKGKEFPGSEDTLGAERYVREYCSEFSGAEQYKIVMALIDRDKLDGVVKEPRAEPIETLQPESQKKEKPRGRPRKIKVEEGSSDE